MQLYLIFPQAVCWRTEIIVRLVFSQNYLKKKRKNCLSYSLKKKKQLQRVKIDRKKALRDNTYSWKSAPARITILKGIK
jgi:hypothetical protein